MHEEEVLLPINTVPIIIYGVKSDQKTQKFELGKKETDFVPGSILDYSLVFGHSRRKN